MAGQPKKFRFTLMALGQVFTLLNAPDNWQSTIVEFKRSATYLGVVRSLTVPFNFVFKGATIVRMVDYTNGLMGVIKLLIEKLNPATWLYSPIFSGKVDMTTIEDNKSFVTASVIEDSLQEKIAAFDGTKYQLKLDVSQAIEIELTPLPFKEKADFVTYFAGSDNSADHFTELSLVGYEQHAINASAKDVTLEFNDSPTWADDASYFFESQIDGTVYFTGLMKGSILSIVGAHCQLAIINNSGVTRYVIVDQTVLSGVLPFTQDLNFSIDVVQGERLFLYSQKLSGSGVLKLTAGSDMHIAYNTQSPASKCNALRASYVFDELIQKMNGKDTGGAYTPYPTISTLLNTILNQVAITCSNSIRKIINGTQYNPGDSLLAGAKYSVINGDITYNSVNYSPGQTFTAVPEVDTFTTGDDGSVILIQYEETILLAFKDFYQAVKAWMGGNAGFGLDGNAAVLEEITYFFRNLVTMDLGKNINQFKSLPAIDQVFNSLKVGYEDQQYDTLNGFQEVNSTQYYTGDLTAIQKELDLVCPIRCDPYGIETLRFTPSDTSASRSDNDVWAIWIKPNPEFGQDYYRPLTTEQLSSITGIDAGGSYYNWRLTPKQCLLRGKPYLASVFNSQTTLRFTSALKNVNLVTVDWLGNRVAERDDVLIQDLGTPAFIPRYFKFNCKLENDALNKLNIMYTAIQFTTFGKQLSGFITEVSCDVAQNSQRDFTLLCAPTVDLKKLIRPVNSQPQPSPPPPAHTILAVINNTDDILITYISGNLPPEILLAGQSKEIPYNAIKDGIKFELDFGYTQTVYTLDYIDIDGNFQEIKSVSEPGIPHGSPFILTANYLQYNNGTLICDFVNRIVEVNQSGSYMLVYILIDDVTLKSSPTGTRYLMTGGGSSTVYQYLIAYTLDNTHIINGEPVEWNFENGDNLYFVLKPFAFEDTDTQQLQIEVSRGGSGGFEVIDTLFIDAGPESEVTYNHELIYSDEFKFYGLSFHPDRLPVLPNPIILNFYNMSSDETIHFGDFGDLMPGFGPLTIQRFFNNTMPDITFDGGNWSVNYMVNVDSGIYLSQTNTSEQLEAFWSEYKKRLDENNQGQDFLDIYLYSD